MLARRRRVVAAHDDYVGEQLVEGRRQHCLGRGRPADHSAQEPSRTVEAEEPDRLELTWQAVIVPDRHLGAQLSPELAVALLAAAARVGDVGSDLVPHLVPQAAAARRGERLELHAAVAVHDRDPGSLLLGDVDLDVEALPDRHEQAAAVDPLGLGVVVCDIPGAAVRRDANPPCLLARRILARGLRPAGRARLIAVLTAATSQHVRAPLPVTRCLAGHPRSDRIRQAASVPARGAIRDDPPEPPRCYPGTTPRNPPVEPNPPSPRADPGSVLTSQKTARSIRWITSCAIRSPRLKLTAASLSVLIIVTAISPRYPASIVPGALTSVTPCRAASPDLGCTNAAKPSGSAIAIPVGTTARSPGFEVDVGRGAQVHAGVAGVRPGWQRQVRVYPPDQHLDLIGPRARRSFRHAHRASTSAGGTTGS